MFCDLVNSTALATRLDPEDLREVIGTYHRCVADTVGRYDGFVAKYMGDGVLAYFGYPQAHEEDAERAVGAGLAVVEAVGDVPAPERLQVRVGIATGVVVVGDLTGSGEAQERGVVGETPNLAARLQAIAEPGAVVIAANTRKLIGNLFECRGLGAVVAKGFSEPVHAWHVLRESGIESRFEAFHSDSLSSLIGREEEAELLLRRWRRAQTGEGQAVLLSGEPGIGKSRLAVALQDTVSSDPHTRLRYFCSPRHQDSALHPFIAHIQQAAGFVRDDAPQVKIDKLAGLFTPALPHGEDLGLLAELLSIPAGDRFSQMNLTPQSKKAKTFQILFRQLEGLARQKHILMIFEDAHWADPTSRELLDLTVERVLRLPILLLVTGRPEFQPSWMGQAHVTAVTLNRLNHHEAASLVDRIVGDRALPRKVVAEIVERADGVPLFAEELTKAVIESGDPGDAGTGAAAEAAARPVLTVPGSLHASLMARLDRLGRLPKDVAQLGSVIGREFSYELVASVAPRGSEEQLPNALQRLAAAALIVQRGRPPAASYVFKHALLQDAVYGSLLRAKRQQIHCAVKTALEEHFPDVVEAQPELIAYHCARAGLVSEAIDYWERAGRRAAQQSANHEAVEHLRKALEMLRRGPEGSERDGRELNLLIALGPALMATRTSADPEVAGTYARAAELARTVGRSAELFPTLWGAHLVALVACDFRTAEKLGQDLFEMARGLDDREFMLQAHHAAFGTLRATGELASAQRHAEALLALYQPEMHARHALLYGAHDPGSCARMMLALILLLRGLPDQSRRQSDEGLSLARALQHPPSLAHVLRLAAELHIIRCEPDTTAKLVAELMPVAMQHGSAVGKASAIMLRGWSRVMQGQKAEGLDDLWEGLRLWRETGPTYYVPYRLGVVADALTAAGRHEDALRIVDEALEAREERWFEAELHRLKGELLLGPHGDCQEDAIICFRQALTVAGAQGARFLELRAAVSLARFWKDNGRSGEARATLLPVYGSFTEGFDMRDLKVARTLIDELTE
jgi:class 3 adenylate cyclase/predicted ATPase